MTVAGIWSEPLEPTIHLPRPIPVGQRPPPARKRNKTARSPTRKVACPGTTLMRSPSTPPWAQTSTVAWASPRQVSSTRIVARVWMPGWPAGPCAKTSTRSTRPRTTRSLARVSSSTVRSSNVVALAGAAASRRRATRAALEVVLIARPPQSTQGPRRAHPRGERSGGEGLRRAGARRQVARLQPGREIRGEELHQRRLLFGRKMHRVRYGLRGRRTKPLRFRAVHKVWITLLRRCQYHQRRVAAPSAPAGPTCRARSRYVRVGSAKKNCGEIGRGVVQPHRAELGAGKNRAPSEANAASAGGAAA